MKLHAAKALGAAVATLAVLVGTAAQASAVEPVSSNALAGPAAYADYLEHSDGNGALDALREFRALTPNEQTRFLSHLQDPSLYTDFLASVVREQSDVTALSRTTRRSAPRGNGDVSFESESVVTGVRAGADGGPLAAGDHTVQRSNKLKVLGVNVVELKIWVSFHSNGRDITRVNDADGGQRNVSLTARASKNEVRQSLGTQQFCARGGSCVGGHTANVSIIWNLEGVGVSYAKRQTLKVSRNGAGAASLQNL